MPIMKKCFHLGNALATTVYLAENCFESTLIEHNVFANNEYLVENNLKGML